jgi:hypothetical protein
VAKGDYFTSTGEVLLPRSTLNGNGDRITAKCDASWTFPLRIAEIVWGDGHETHYQTVPLSDTKEFGKDTFTWETAAPNWKWARLAVWDIAGNGAFTTPVWRN